MILSGSGVGQPFPVALNEGDVRRLAGPGVFRRGDVLQRAGHVIDPTAQPDSLGAQVLGTWRRADLVTVTSTSGTLQSSCTCRGGAFCRHAAALLLHWVRARASFVSALGAEILGDEYDNYEEYDEFGYESGDESEWPLVGEETAIAQYSRLLESYAMNDLRLLAKRRGERVTARTKAELVDTLGRVLAGPESMDIAIAGLNEEQRLTLDLTDLLAPAGGAQAGDVSAAYIALGGSEKVTSGLLPTTMRTLVDLGLVIPVVSRVGEPRYAVPDAVRYRLTTAVSVLRPSLRATSKDIPADRREESPKLNIVEVCQVVFREVEQGRIGQRLLPWEIPASPALPLGWQIDGGVPDRSPQLPPYGASDIVLNPAPSFLPLPDILNLVELTGRSVAMLTFALDLMVSLGLIELAPGAAQQRLVTRPNRWLRVLLASPAERTSLLVNAWLKMSAPTELHLIAGTAGPLELHYNPSLAGWWSPQQPHVAAVRRRIYRLLIRDLDDGEAVSAAWRDPDSLVELCRKLEPRLLQGEAATSREAWWFVDPRRSQERLKLSEKRDWQFIWRAVVAAILAGPMHWLGLVELAPGNHGPVGFRPLPALRGFGELEAKEGFDAPLAGSFTFAPDPEDGDRGRAPGSIIVPAGTPAEAAHRTLALLGELADASPAGLCYRLTTNRVREQFDLGLTIRDLVRVLESHAGGSLPDELRATLERWWSGFGTIRLYDDITLIELADDLLLAELLATSTLGSALVHTFSPRLIAVDPTMVDGILADLTRFGHTPHLLEDV